MDDEILKTVHSIFGKSVQIVDCEKTSSVRQEEVLLINGIPVTLDGQDGDAIKSALLTGQVPSVELLNQLLYQAGILRQPVQLETSLSVKSSMVTTEEVSVARGGHILDGRTTETKEDYVYNSTEKEIWEPVAVKTCPEQETMAYTPRFRLVQQAHTSSPQSSSSSSSVAEGAAGRMQNAAASSCSSVNPPPLLSQIPSAATVKRSTIDITNPMLTGDSSSHDSSYFYNYSGNEQKLADEDGDDDDEEDDDEDGELYLLNPQPTIHSPPSPFVNRLPPIRSATTTISSSRDYIHDDLRKKYQKSTGLSKSSIASMSGKKSSLLSYDSGHDGVFHSPSQQTATSNAMLVPLQQSTTNTDQSISSSYDFISSDEADFLNATTNNNSNSNSNMGKNCKTIFATTKERSYADLHREQSHTSKSSNEKNVKSPFLGKITSMSSSNCVSSNAPSPQSKQQQLHRLPLQNAGASSKSTNANVNPSDAATVTTASTISTTSVENGLVFRDGNLISGPLDSLIAHMVPTSNYYPDRSFIFSFLLSARLFIRPHELLSRISETWEIQQQCQALTPESFDVVDEKSAQAQSIRCSGGGGSVNRSQQIYPPQFADKQNQQKAMISAQNCIQLLAEWIDTFPYDFRDERLMQHVRVLARKCVYIDNSLGKTVSSILQNLVQRLTVLEKYEEFLQTLAVNESNELSSTGDDIGTHHKPFSSSLSSGGQTNSGYVHAGSISSNEREDWTAVEASTAVAVANTTSTSGGNSHKTSIAASYEAGSSGSHQNQAFHYTHHNNHQSDSSSNYVDTLGAGGVSLGIGTCTSNGVELTDICDLCPNAALLAYQLTHIELERLSHIGPEEFVQAFAKENHLESFSDMKKTRNLESYVQWFNRLSYFTATEIVKYSKKKQRVRIIEFWIETARECFNIGNFNSLMAIIAGLNLSPISRLKKTWSKIQSAKFSVLEHQMDPTSNFNSYRSTLKAAMWRSEGATDERERIIIPFFSLLVKDLYFLNEGCSNRLPNGHINFEKFWQLAKQVMEFNTWKKVTCPFKKLPKVIMFLQMSPVLNENTLSMASFECEPPENHQEKGRYKTLKSETKQQQQQQQQQT